MNRPIVLHRLFHFFIVKIIIGIAIVGGAVFFTEWSGRLILEYTSLQDPKKNVILAILDSAAALLSYIFLFRFYENRQINELSGSPFLKNSIAGLTTGLMLQSLFILVLYLAGGYSVTRVNSVSSLILPFTTAFTAGFVAEIIIRGIVFRLLEEKSGTKTALFLLTLLFGLLHVNAAGATTLSVLTTAIQAGLLLSAVYVWTRNLWTTIFLHFAWDFAEPGIFGAINPGNTIKQSLLTSKISGPVLLTGGQTGPQNSIQSLILCSLTALLIIWLAKRKHNFINSYWRK